MPSHRWAIVATILSILLAFLQAGIAFFITHEGSQYDPDVAVLTATLISVIWYTQYHFDELAHARTRDATERRRATTALATGVLEELRWLDKVLYHVFMSGPGLLYDPLEHPVIEAAMGQNTLFTPATVAQLTGFHATLRDTRATINEFRSRRIDFDADTEARFALFARKKAALTIQAMPSLIDALKEEGGVTAQIAESPDFADDGPPLLSVSPFGPRAIR